MWSLIYEMRHPKTGHVVEVSEVADYRYYEALGYVVVDMYSRLV